jgi:hypothetical protein
LEEPIYCPIADLIPNLVCQVPKFGTKGKEKCIILMLKHMRIVVKFGTKVVAKDATKFGTIFAYAHLEPLLINELCIMNYHTKHHTMSTTSILTLTLQKSCTTKCSEHYKILQH